MTTEDKLTNEVPETGPSAEESASDSPAEGAVSEGSSKVAAPPLPPVHARLEELTGSMLRTGVPDFRPGDTVRVHVKIIEGNKERIQAFEGVVIAIKHGGIDKTFTVRKTSWGVGVERTFFVNSPKIDRIDLVRRGRVRRAKLYYLRQRAGKSARIAEKRKARVEQPAEES